MGRNGMQSTSGTTTYSVGGWMNGMSLAFEILLASLLHVTCLRYTCIVLAFEE